MASADRSAFVTRFDRIWSQARRVQLSQALCWAVLTALAGIALLAALDYWLELPQAFRFAALIAIGLAALAVAVGLAVRSVRRWKRQATAAAIEQVFPQLGQRIRTTVQYGELSANEIEGEGVATTLVAALETDTVRRAQPLPLDAVIPWKSLALVSLLAAVVGLSLAGASAFDWEWRAAATRAFLGQQPYTRIDVEPGHLTVKEGASAVIRVAVSGRTGKKVAFWSRQLDSAGSEWVEQPLPAEKAQAKDDRTLAWEVPLDRIRHPLAYRVSAGSTNGKTFRIKVLYPLKLARLQTTISPPGYTGLDEQVIEGGNITGLVGSKAELQVELDRAPKTAWMEIRDAALPRKAAEAAARKVPLTIQGKMLSTEFELSTDQVFRIYAQAADGMELPENTQRVRVRQDEPPQVWFESPAEALEVHALAEILMRVRVSDDFGLSRSGVMFEVNNEEEYPLLAQDFQAALAEQKATGKLSPQTRASLEKLLPLEHFDLTQKDSIMYYAFAEDNRPGSAQRTESDLRFIDIRPFRRLYRVLDADADTMNNNQGPELKSLEELIARQRYALNRTIQLARKFERGGQADLAGVDALIKFEGDLARFTRELAEGLEARGIDETELLYQAETEMLGATDSLSAGKYDTATLQQRDALKDLIEGRDRLQVFLNKNPNKAQLAQVRQFDRTQQQKLRRPKTDDEEAREVAQRLKELADREDFVYKSLAGVPTADGAPTDDPQNGEGAGQQKPANKPESEGAEGETNPTDKLRSDGQANAESGENPDGNQPAETDNPGQGAPSLEDLEGRQLDIALESREIEKLLGKLKGITDLAKERMASSAKASEDAAAAMGRGEMKEAQQAAQDAGGKFLELSEQVRALLAQEQADRIAAAQRMAANLARQQQDFVDQLSNPSEDKGGDADPRQKPDDEAIGRGAQENKESKLPGLGGMAAEIAERAQTLADVMGAAAKADEPGDQESAGKVEQLMNSLSLPAMTERLAQLPQQVEGGQLDEAQAAAGDGAERLDAAAERLANIHLAIVAPQVGELGKVEQDLSELDNELDRLDNDERITGWHRQADMVLDELQKSGMADELREELQKVMRAAGWTPTVRARAWNWGLTEGGYYAAPSPYRLLLSRLLASVRGRMQELMLGDLAAGGDEPIPPQYRELVDRFYQVLAAEGKQRVQRKPE